MDNDDGSGLPQLIIKLARCCRSQMSLPIPLSQIPGAFFSGANKPSCSHEKNFTLQIHSSYPI